MPRENSKTQLEGAHETALALQDLEASSTRPADDHAPPLGPPVKGAASASASRGFAQLTPTQLFTHLACAYTQLERRRRAGELEVELMPDPRLDAMRTRGAAHERAYIEQLLEKGLTVRDLRESRDPRATLTPAHILSKCERIKLWRLGV